MLEDYKEIFNCINERLKSDKQMLEFYQEMLKTANEKVAELQKENAELKEKIEDLTF